MLVQVRKAYEDLRKKRLDEFMAGFTVISLKLKEMYQMITLGGDAELELVDSLDPFSEVKFISFAGNPLADLSLRTLHAMKITTLGTLETCRHLK